MPANQKKAKVFGKTNLGAQFDCDKEDEAGDSLDQCTVEKQSRSKEQSQKVKSRKREAETPVDDFQYSDPEDEIDGKQDEPVELDMQNLLSGFGAEISKNVNAKRKRIQNFAHASMKATTRKFDEVWRYQRTESDKRHEEFQKQLTVLLKQWDTDIQKTKEAEEKLENLFKQQQRLFQQQRIVQGQRLNRIRQLFDEYSKGMQELEKCHLEHRTNVQDQLRKEINALQKRILVDTQQQDISNVRRSLQSVLAQV